MESRTRLAGRGNRRTIAEVHVDAGAEVRKIVRCELSRFFTSALEKKYPGLEKLASMAPLIRGGGDCFACPTFDAEWISNNKDSGGGRDFFTSVRVVRQPGRRGRAEASAERRGHGSGRGAPPGAGTSQAPQSGDQRRQRFILRVWRSCEEIEQMS